MKDITRCYYIYADSPNNLRRKIWGICFDGWLREGNVTRNLVSDSILEIISMGNVEIAVSKIT